MQICFYQFLICPCDVCYALFSNVLDLLPSLKSWPFQPLRNYLTKYYASDFQWPWPSLNLASPPSWPDVKHGYLTNHNRRSVIWCIKRAGVDKGLTTLISNNLSGSNCTYFYLGKNVWKDVVASNYRQTELSLKGIFFQRSHRSYSCKNISKMVKSPPLSYYERILALDRGWKKLEIPHVWHITAKKCYDSKWPWSTG